MEEEEVNVVGPVKESRCRERENLGVKKGLSGGCV